MFYLIYYTVSEGFVFRINGDYFESTSNVPSQCGKYVLYFLCFPHFIGRSGFVLCRTKNALHFLNRGPLGY